MDAYLIRINQKQFKSALSEVSKEPVFLNTLKAAHPEVEEKQIKKLSFTQEFVVKELGFDQDFQRTNQRWSKVKPDFALISIPNLSPSNFDLEGYELLKKVLVSKSESSILFSEKADLDTDIADQYGTLNIVQLKESGYTEDINLKSLGFGIEQHSVGVVALSSDYILELHPSASKEDMAILAEHYSVMMPRSRSNSISEFFTRLSRIAFCPQEKCHINFITRLFMTYQRDEIKKLTTKFNIEKLPELEGTPKQIIFATDLRMKRMREFGADDYLVQSVRHSVEWIDCYELKQLDLVKPPSMSQYF